MADPETDFPSESSLEAETDTGPDGTADLILETENKTWRDGPDEDDDEAAYDPDGVEPSRARELGLKGGREQPVFDRAEVDDEIETIRDDIDPPDVND